MAHQPLGSCHGHHRPVHALSRTANGDVRQRLHVETGSFRFPKRTNMVCHCRRRTYTPVCRTFIPPQTPLSSARRYFPMRDRTTWQTPSDADARGPFTLRTAFVPPKFAIGSPEGESPPSHRSFDVISRVSRAPEEEMRIVPLPSDHTPIQSRTGCSDGAGSRAIFVFGIQETNSRFCP